MTRSYPLMISFMRNWGQEFGLINLTRLKQSDYELNDRLLDGTLFKLTAEIAVDCAVYRGLPPWDKAAARAFAVGMTMDKAVVGGQAAARLWELATLRVEKQVVCHLPDGGIPSSPKTWPEGVIYRYGRLDTGDIREYHGIRVTSLMRLLLDIAHYEGLHAAVVVIDSARRKYPELTEGELHRRLGAYRRYRGLRVLRRAIELSVPNSDSAQETRARLILHEANLPGIRSIQPQVRFNRDRGGRFYVVDFLINGWIIVEIDGRSKYKLTARRSWTMLSWRNVNGRSSSPTKAMWFCVLSRSNWMERNQNFSDYSEKPWRPEHQRISGRWPE